VSPSLDWMERALCVGHPNPDIFFPNETGHAGRRQAERAARICAECPVADMCADHRQRTGATAGVWGGGHGTPRPIVTPRQTPIKHGTDSGYRQHTRRGVPYCDDCRAAHKYMMQEWAANHPRVRTPEQLAAQKARRQRGVSA
jgi:hypothetical protein